MDYLQLLLHNRVLMAAMIGFMSAQVIKALLYLLVNRKFRFERLVGSGGMPSSHASMVCAAAVATGRIYGLGSFAFAIATLVAIVVIYDARGVRLETGKQAVTISAILDHLLEEGTILDIPKMELKELVGHTPFQVFVGSVLGVALGFLV